MIWTPVFLGISLVCVMGLGALVHGMATEEEAAYLINNTDEVVGFMLNKFDNPLINGICVAGLFAAGMSSLASVIIIIGTAFVKDIWHLISPMPENKIIPRTKAFAGAVFAASFFPAIFGGLYLKWGTDVAALSSMIVGMLVNIIWRFAFRFEYEGLKDIHEIIPAFLIAMVTYLVVSWFTPSRRPDDGHLEVVFGK